MRQSWTDDRLDDFRGEVGLRFDQVDKRFDRVEDRIQGLQGELNAQGLEMKQGFEAQALEMKRGFERVDERFDSMHRLMVQFAGGMVFAVVGLFAGMLGFLATQL